MRRSCQHGAGVKGSDWVDIRQGTLRVCSRRSSLDKSTCGTTRNIAGLMSAIQQRYDHPHRGDGSDRTWFWKRYKRSPSSLNCSPSSAIVFLRSTNLLPARFFSSLASVPSNFLVNSFSKSFSSTTRKDMALPPELGSIWYFPASVPAADHPTDRPEFCRQGAEVGVIGLE